MTAPTVGSPPSTRSISSGSTRTPPTFSWWSRRPRNSNRPSRTTAWSPVRKARAPDGSSTKRPSAAAMSPEVPVDDADPADDQLAGDSFGSGPAGVVDDRDRCPRYRRADRYRVLAGDAAMNGGPHRRLGRAVLVVEDGTGAERGVPSDETGRARLAGHDHDIRPRCPIGAPLDQRLVEGRHHQRVGHLP